MKRLLVATLALLVTLPALAAAQPKPQPTTAKPAATKPAPIRSFVDPNTVFKSPDDWADKLEMCDTRKTPWRLTCKQLLDAFNALPQFDDFDSIQEVAGYIRKEIGVRPCPSVQAELDIAGVQGDDVVYIKRQCRPNESLFVDIGKGLALASTICGQYIRNEVGFFSATTDTPVGTADGDPGLSNLKASIDDIARRVVIAEGKQSGGTRHDEGKRSFMDRHWPKMVTTGVLATVGIAVWKGLFRQTQEVNQNVCVGGACR